MPTVEARHQHTAGRCTNRASRVAVGKARSLCRETIDAWRLNFLLAVAAEIAVPEVIQHEPDDIRKPLLCISARALEERCPAEPSGTREQIPTGRMLHGVHYARTARKTQL